MSDTNTVSIAPSVNSLVSATPEKDESARDVNERNYETFLSILTTQVRHQNPLDPLDSSKYTEQLVQFTSVEQQIKTNTRLDNLLAEIRSSTASGYVNYIGRKVMAGSDMAALHNGAAEWQYRAASDGVAEITISDSAGLKMVSFEQDIAAGSHTFRWDGKLADGTIAPPGAYSLTIRPQNGDGSAGAPLAIAAPALVTGVDFATSPPRLIANGRPVPITDIQSVEGDTP